MSFKINKEETLVNTVPVDAEGGAKPEPEERPLETYLQVENLTDRRAPAPVTHFAPKQTTIVVSEVIATAKDRLGKQCGHCVHFNAEQGRYLMDQIRMASNRGDPQATHYLRTLRAHALGEKGAALDPDIYTSSPNAPDILDQYVSELGFCRAYSELLNDVMFQHPTETCQSETALQEMADTTGGWPGKHLDELMKLKPSERLTHSSRPKPLPLLYQPRDSTIERLTTEMLSNVMFTAEAAKKA